MEGFILALGFKEFSPYLLRQSMVPEEVGGGYSPGDGQEAEPGDGQEAEEWGQGARMRYDLKEMPPGAYFLQASLTGHSSTIS